MTKRPFIAMSTVLLCAIAFAALTACGSSGGGSSSTASSSAATSQGVTAALEATDRLSKAPASIGIHEPLKGSVRGKTIAYMQCPTPICAVLGHVIQQAAGELGMKFRLFAVGATPDTVASAYDSAVQSKPDAVFSAAVPTALWAKQLAQFAHQGTMVFTNITLARPSQGVTAQFYDHAVAYNVGEEMADRVIADSHGNAKTVLVYAPEFTGVTATVDGYRAKLRSACPECSVDGLPVLATDVGKVVPGRVVSYLQQHPGVNYVVFEYGDLATGVPQAMSTAGVTGVKLISTAGTPVNYVYIKSGQQQADLSNYLDVFAWQMVDTMARAMLHQPYKVPEPPLGWVTKGNANFNPNGFPPFGDPNWRAEFLKLWNQPT